MVTHLKKTLVIGASENPSRYSFLAINALRKKAIEVEAIGLRTGNVADVVFRTGQPELSGIHTVTLYVGPQHQAGLYDYILSLKPKRVIFNPGTENLEFMPLLEQQGIEATEACTLVLLNTGQY